jgi:DNA replication protein DnaC
LGKTHLCIALGHEACVRVYSVLFTTAIDIIHTLSAAAATGSLKRTMQRYLKPKLLVVDELGYLPIDKLGADLLFQIISERYERGAILSFNGPEAIFSHISPINGLLYAVTPDFWWNVQYISRS